MASSYTSLALGALLLMSCVSWGSAATYTVGDSQGWTFNVNYSTWASDKKFVVGDKLVFNYQTGQHTVAEVSSSDYNSCSSSNPISTNTTGPTTITLATAGSHYYICTKTGHCSAGMKLAVNVAASSPSTPTSPTTPSTPTAPSPSTPTVPAPSNSSSGAAAGLVPTLSAVAAIAGLVATLF
uniref:Phytocyanin domain-containing protein n=1 Tax=Ananas comosus var. bracteatus TaxID=296719 RepID=A0A6V7P642_ANACO|nr:unnamed protein product [Ananas comosus var. bracteatus]